MTTYQVTPTDRYAAATSYNRTTRMWRDGGEIVDVDICDDDSGSTLAELSNDDLLEVAQAISDSERSDAADLALELLDEIERRIALLDEDIAAWDGEYARDLADMLNAVEDYCARASKAFEYIAPGMWDYDFRSNADLTSLPWHGTTEPSMAREDVYASDKSDRWLVLVVGTTDDGWTIEEAGEHDV